MKNLIRRGGLILMWLAAAVATQASIIYVQGTVSGVWSADTVMVTGEVRVPPRETLEIQPGVQVLFRGHYKFVINGILEAIGTPGDSISFGAIGAAGWHGLRFINAPAESHLEYCRIQQGRALGFDPDTYGGGIYCYASSPILHHLSIFENTAAHSGGGIWCQAGAQPTITDCLIRNNSSGVFGAGIGCWDAAPTIENCVILENDAGDDGGGIFCYHSDPTIRNCLISGNSAVEWGGGICVGWVSVPDIARCLIDGNAGGDGGGVYVFNSYFAMRGSLISNNLATGGGGVYTHNDGGGIFLGYSLAGALSLHESIIVGNHARRHGGGIHCGSSYNLYLSKCAVNGNEADERGGGIALYNAAGCSMQRVTIARNSAYRTAGGIYTWCYSAANLGNGAVWSNTPEQIIYISPLQTNYCDIQGGWPGLGNINIYPAFVDTAHDDYRLLWGSPCIDAGDPNPIYYDPDGTRADMGAFYYDQSRSVRILLTPHQIPYLIPESGGSVDYTIRAFNRDSSAHSAIIWCDVMLPDSSVFGPVLGPVEITLGPGALLERVRTQNFPAAAPMGVYHYDAYAVVGQDTSKDSFMFGKLGSGGLGLGTSTWTNAGERAKDAISPVAGAHSAAADAPANFALYSCSPNPFNARTVLSYQLPVASYVNLQVYNVAGRVEKSLVIGWRDAGLHEVTFDAADLPSGIYVCRIRAGSFEAVQKMVLLK